MALQLLHCTDLHLDKNFNIPIYSRALERKEDLNRNFTLIVNYALKNKPDLFLISGDVFDKISPTNAARVFFTQQMKLLKEADIHVFLIGGNHDVPKVGYHPPLAIDVLQSAGLATVFNRSDILQQKTLNVNKKRVCVSGKSYYPQFERGNPLQDVNIPLDGDYNILLLHASLQGFNVIPASQEIMLQNPITSQDIKKGLTYLALGHFHYHFEKTYRGCTIVNPGSIEKLSWAEMNDEKGFVWAEMNGSEISTEFVKIPTRPMEHCELTISKNMEYLPTIKDYAVEHLSQIADQTKMVRFDINGLISQDQYAQLKVNEIYTMTRNLLFHLYIDRQELEVEGYGRIFLEKIDNPITAFTKRLDTLILSADTDEEKHLLDEVKQLGVKYLGAAK